MNNTLIDKKVEYWENQLLDLSKRNKMLSYRETKRATLKITEPSFNDLFTRVAINEEELTFQKPIDKDSDIRIYSILSLLDTLSAPVEVNVGDIKTEGTVAEAKKTLKNLRAKSKLSLDEQGTNILYLVFGFVEWREKSTKDEWRKSPLILVPVSILLESLNSPYVLKKYEDDIVVNPTLAYMFSRDYGIELPSFDLDEDTLESFMEKMESLVDKRGWKVLRECSIGLVSFLKINMYNDLINHEEALKNNPIIRAFAGEKNEINSVAGEQFVFDHDATKAMDTFMVVDADSSQQDAIMLAKNGISFVMQGPPGTGKSQTITNIIAQGLADGKKILFVSEKMAALEVVYKRLTEVHLADFCLPLHSHKADKKSVLEDLGKNLNLKHIKVKDEEIAKLTELDVLKEYLKGYVHDIHKTIMPLEMSPYEVYGEIVSMAELPDIPVTLDNIDNLSKDQVNRLCLLATNFDNAKNVLGPKWYKNPWQGITIDYLEVGEKRELQEKLETGVRSIRNSMEVLLKGKTLSDVVTLNNIDKYTELAGQASVCCMVSADWFIRKLDQEEKYVEEQKQNKELIHKLKNELMARYDKDYFVLDGNAILERLNSVVPAIINQGFDNISASELYEKRQEYYDYLQELVADLVLLRDTYKILVGEYGLTGTDTVATLSSYLELCEIMLKKRNYTRYYFQIEELKRIKQLVDELPALFADLAKRKEVIVEKYDERVLVNTDVKQNLTILSDEKNYIEETELKSIPEKEQIGEIIENATGLVKKVEESLQSETIAAFVDLYKIKQPKTIVEIKRNISAVSSVLEKRPYVEKWIDETFLQQAINILKESVQNHSEIIEAQNSLRDFYNNSALILDFDKVSEETIEILEKLQQSFSELEKLVANYDSEAAYTLLHEITNNRSILLAAKETICSEKNKYHILDTLSNESLLDILEEYHDKLIECRPLEKWASSIDKIKKLLNQQIEKSNILKDLHEKIISKCEITVFDLEYGPILDRFKSEYTNFFKIFKSSYRDDVKKIRVVYKEVRKKIPDEEIVELLQSLKAYHEAMDTYMQSATAVELLLGISKFDMWFDWGATLERVVTFEEVGKNFANLSSLHAFLIEGALDRMNKELHTYQNMVQWFRDNKGKEYFGELYKDIDTEESIIEEKLQLIRELSTVFVSDEKLKQFLENDMRNQSLLMAMTNVTTILNKREWFINHAENINTLLGSIYCEKNIAWDEIERNIQNFENIISVFGKESGSKILKDTEFHTTFWGEVYDKLMNCMELQKCYCVTYNKESLPEKIEEQDIEEVIENIHGLINSLNNVNCVYERIEAWRLDKSVVESIESAIDELKAIVDYQDLFNPYQNNQETYIELLGSDYAHDKTKWDVLNENIKNAECVLELVKYDVSSQLQNALLTGKRSYSEAQLKELHDTIVKVGRLEEKCPLIAKNLILENKIKIITQVIADLKEYIKICSTLAGNSFSEYNYEELSNDIGTLAKLQYTENIYKKQIDNATGKFHMFNLNYDTDWNSIDDVLRSIKNVKRLIVVYNIDQEVADFVTRKDSSKSVEEMKIALEKVNHYREMLMGLISMFENKEKLCDIPLHKLCNKFENCLEQFSTMDSWIDFRDCREQCKANGLGTFATAAEDIVYPNGMLNKVLLKSIYYVWFAKVCAGIDSVAKFKVRVQNSRVENFRELDGHQLPVAQMRIRKRLINGMPSRSNFSHATDEMSLLMHELGKKRKIMPLRKLFRTIPNLLLKLKPCLMMSPLSVSYFLEADTYKFDMVIFDEASQIFPQDAIGAIFRGAQVIIAGDSKQLPPTNFFAASTSNTDSDYDVDDEVEEIISDSILEEATSSLPNRSLLWHYRSRNEDLISFSNQEIYQNNLITFPSSVNKVADLGVEYIYVENGVYENRCNKKEAERCVALIEEHIKKHPNRSLGIIAFSESQQSAIEEALNDFRLRNKKYESFFDEKKEDAFFIKNLENVQGDERDTIIFSICYGKNAQGRMYMRFGPLGYQGGERRLNVAITRAKHNVKLVGSILPEDIDLNKTKSDGVKMLRSYIRFAMEGSNMLSKPKKQNQLYEVDTFSQYVGEFLEKRGFKIKMNVGNSDYTVDIAVEHPKREGCYFAGVECDGNSYYMARTVRDRDHLRTAVLEQMGWKMYRVWSTEWIRNPENEQRRLVEFLGEAINSYEIVEERKPVEINSHDEVKDVVDEVKVEPVFNRVNTNTPYGLPLYEIGHWYNVKKNRAQDNLSRLADMIHEVVRVEQPLHMELLYRRLAGAFGNEKATAPIKRTVDEAIKQRMQGEVRIENDFITLTSFRNVIARRSSAGSPDRNIEHISRDEIVEVMKKVLYGAYGMERNTLIFETARVFGFVRTGVNIRCSMNEAIDYLEKQNVVRISDDKIQLVEG